MVRGARAADWRRVREIYTRFLPLIVFEQQPGVAIRKEILRLRGAIESNRVRHPGGSLPPGVARQLHKLIEELLPGQDLTRQIVV
jgi:4-hydroxy-tetrahydrodipicolinate synthase